MRIRLIVVAALAVTLGAGAGTSASAAPLKPIRVAAYYPWFPEGWTYADMDPFTHFRPSLGFYDAGDPRVIARHVTAMRWGRIQAATYSWWGRHSPTDSRLAQHLATAAQHAFRFAVYYEAEGYADPSVAEIRADLEYLREMYSASPGYLKLGGRFVVFVYGDADDAVGCNVTARWGEANEGIGAFVVLRSFSGFRSCHSQPSGWHAYSAHRYEFDLRPFAYSISPGFFFAPDDRPRRKRSLANWRRSVRRMAASGALFQYVISFNEWGEGTAIEPAREWRSRSGYGTYLDALHDSR
jgi:Glycosyl hydrolase family 99